MHFKEWINESTVSFCDYILIIDINPYLNQPQLSLFSSSNLYSIILHAALFLLGAYEYHPISCWAEIR